MPLIPIARVQGLFSFSENQFFMATVIRSVGFNLHFGTGYETPLPAGWVLHESPEDWAMATAPDGKRYLLSSKKAYPIIEIVSRRESPLCGCIHADFENGIIDLPSAS